jgi:PAS domain S-box-containing protein
MKTLQPTAAGESKSGNGSAVISRLNKDSLKYREHAVQFYESEAFLAQSASTFIEKGLKTGESGIVIGTQDHRDAVAKQLLERKVDLRALRAKGRYISIDAAETLSRFVLDGWPDEQRFKKVIGTLLTKAAGAPRRGVRVFCELVALLWAEGNREGAIRLEELWNELDRTQSFNLLCACWMGQFCGTSNAELFNRICRAHSVVAPTETCVPPDRRESSGHGAMAVLEQKARSLEAEIAEHKHIERVLRASEVRLQEAIEDRARAEESRYLAAMVESSDDAIISKDLSGIITSWNRAAERIFGYTAEEIVGLSVTILIPQDRQNEEPRILARLRKGERIDHYETIRRRKDGTDLNVSLTVSPIKDETGRIIGASKIARDITERKRAESVQRVLFELACAVNRAVALPEIYEAALTAICRSQQADRASILLYDAEGVMRFKAWRGLSKKYRQAVEGHSPWRRDDSAPKPVCIEDVARAELDDALRAVVLGEGIQALAFLPVTYEGKLLGKFMIYYDTPHRFTPEELQPTQAIINQVAFAIERQKAGETLERTVSERTASLREAVAQMEEFSYTVSHDLRAPVRAMQCYAEVLMEDYGSQLEENAKRYLERIMLGGSRMDRLIQDMLTYSRLNRRDMRLGPVSLDKLTRDLFRQFLDADNLQADLLIEEELLDVVGHEPSLMQAVSNLLHNAMKFVAPGTKPKVRVRTDRRSGDVRLWVEDNGIGVRPEYQHRLFSVFERIHRERNYDGTGIGLAIVRKAVERMGGKVGVESDGVNGSRFWIQLPAVRPV